MRDKLREYYLSVKYDPYRRGLFLGYSMGVGSMLLAGYALRLNYDFEGIYIPDYIIASMRETGTAAMTKKGDAHLLISFAPKAA